MGLRCADLSPRRAAKPLTGGFSPASRARSNSQWWRGPPGFADVRRDRFPCTSLFSGTGPGRPKRPVAGRTETGTARAGRCRQYPAIRDGLSVSGFGEGAVMSGLFPGLQGPGSYPGSAWRCCQSNANLSPPGAGGAGGAEPSRRASSTQPGRLSVGPCMSLG